MPKHVRDSTYWCATSDNRIQTAIRVLLKADSLSSYHEIYCADHSVTEARHHPEKVCL